MRHRFFVVIVSGKKLLIRYEDGPQKRGFHAVRVVQGESEEEAVAKAIELVKSDQELLSVLVEPPSEDFVAEVEREILPPRDAPANTGFIFFDEDDEPASNA